MNKIHKKRLLNVARACRETLYIKGFTMNHFGNYKKDTCGTPACALGNYAFRRDLQKTFRLNGNNISLSDGSQCFVDDPWEHVTDHFGITWTEADELFERIGCGDAKTHLQAANYIERFVKRH